MLSVRELARRHRPLLPLVEYALKEGWNVSRAEGGSLQLLKPGLPPIYTCAIPGEYLSRAALEARPGRTDRRDQRQGDAPWPR